MSVEQAKKDHEIVRNRILDCINNKRSFYVLAGAGAGKTKSLVDVLDDIKQEYRDSYLSQGQKVAVITYTDKAAEEIRQRVGQEQMYRISTIHSFAWEVISHFKKELIMWVKENKTDFPRVKKVEYTMQKSTDHIYRLKHNEVISVFTELLNRSQLLKETVISEFPVILLDEYQDTDKKVIDILLGLRNFNKNLVLALFGDPMQRIYNSGYSYLEDKLDQENFIKIEKDWNWRSSYEIVEFINKVRNIETDPGQKLKMNSHGFVQKSVHQKSEKKPEIIVVAEGTKDSFIEKGNMKTLVLEHRMAAERMGFLDLFKLFNGNEYFKESFKEGSVTKLQDLKLPLLDLYRAKENKYSRLHLMKYMRDYNVYFKENHIFDEEIDIREKLKQLAESYKETLSLFTEPEKITIKEISKTIIESELFYIPNEIDFSDDFWSEVGKISMKELLAYFIYKENMEFETQHGSKGLEYDRVQVILSQKEAKGYLHNFNQLLRIEELSDSIFKNHDLKKDTTLTRTKKLFYVAASRAMEELYIVWYVPVEKVTTAKENLKILFGDSCVIK